MILRTLMWFVVGFALSCGAAAYGLRGVVLPLLAAGVIPVWLICCIRAKRRSRHSVLSAVLLGVILGNIWFYGYDAWRLQPAREADGSTQEITFRVSGSPWDTERGIAANGQISLNGQHYRVRLYMNGAYRLSPGDVVRTTAKLRFTDIGGAKEPTFHRTGGTMLLAYQSGDASVEENPPGLRDLPELMRASSLDMIERYIPGEAAGMAKALLLSDRSDLSYLRSSQFSVTGISHIVAVSGLHVSILFAVLYCLAGKRRYATALIGVPCLLFFAAMAGFVPSATRACIMQILLMLSLMTNREYDPPTALAAAVLVMLLWNPLVIAAVGFQMSVAAVAGIFLFYGKISRWLGGLLPQGKKKSKTKKLRIWLTTSISVTLSATILTLPLVAWYFGTVSLISPISNLLVLPVVSFIFYGTAMVCLIGHVIPVLAGIVGWGTAILIRYVFAVTEMLSGLPFAAVYTRSVYVVFWLCYCYAALTVLLGSKEKRPIPAILSCVAALGIALTASYGEVRLEDYRVTALDVGQGQCILMQCNGKTYMSDCGGSYGKDAGDYAARTLLSQGIFRLDGLIISHYDEDHIGGAEYLLQRMEVDTVYIPDIEGMEEFQQRLLRVAEDVKLCPVQQDMVLPIGEGQITIFAPRQASNSNDSGMAVLFQRGKYDTLITGDLGSGRERELAAEKELPDCEVLVVGHHGSKSSTSEELLSAITPEAAMISSGRNNRYGHPNGEVLSRLTEFGCHIFRTDLMGDLIYRG